MILSITLLVILILINGMFASAELAFLSINKIKLKEDIKKNNKKAIAINKILEDPSSFLSTIQIGITLAGFLASAFAADYFADYFLKIINIQIISKTLLRTILVIIITIVLSYFTLIFGELVPKKVAINNPYKIAKLFVKPINIIKKIFYPLIKLLTISTNIICKIFKIKEKENNFTIEDVKKTIILGKEEGIIEEKEKEYILNIFEFNDIEVGKIMTKKDKVIMLNINDSKKEIISKIKKTKYTRYPVYENNINNLIGVLNVKDLIINYKENNNIEFKNIIRPIHKFNEYEKIDNIFKYMQEKKEIMIAIYNKEKFVGIVTIEDLIEEIVGNIYDEYDITK